MVAVLIMVGGCGLAFWSLKKGGPTPAETAQISAPVASSSAPPAAPTAQRIGDWVVVCPADAAGQAGCFIQQQWRNQQKQLVVVWTLRKDASGVHAVWEVPSDIVHERGMIMDLADGKPKGLPFSGCTAQVCTANALLAPDYLRSLETAPSVTAAVSAPGKADPVRFTLGAKGLSEALGMLPPG